jgi:uncharacterized membrane protein
MTEFKTKTILRIISYRLVALFITSIMIGIPKAVYLHIILTIVHYIHERIWLKIK